MKMEFPLLLSVALTTTAFGMDKPEGIIFSCTSTSNKKISISRHHDIITYIYGKAGSPPELELSRPKSSLIISLETPSGRYLSNSVTIKNGEYTYTLYSNIDRVSSNQNPKSGILIKRKDSYLGTVDCIPGSESGSLLDIDEK